MTLAISPLRFYAPLAVGWREAALVTDRWWDKGWAHPAYVPAALTPESASTTIQTAGGSQRRPKYIVRKSWRGAGGVKKQKRRWGGRSSTPKPAGRIADAATRGGDEA